MKKLKQKLVKLYLSFLTEEMRMEVVQNFLNEQRRYHLSKTLSILPQKNRIMHYKSAVNIADVALRIKLDYAIKQLKKTS